MTRETTFEIVEIVLVFGGSPIQSLLGSCTRKKGKLICLAKYAPDGIPTGRRLRGENSHVDVSNGSTKRTLEAANLSESNDLHNGTVVPAEQPGPADCTPPTGFTNSDPD
jgi:hypothetical protein